jgi:hypothetical protein
MYTARIDKITRPRRVRITIEYIGDVWNDGTTWAPEFGMIILKEIYTMSTNAIKARV